MSKGRIEKLEPSLDGRPLVEKAQYLEPPSKPRFRKTRTLLYYTLLAILVTPLVVLAFFWIHNNFWPKHLSLWLDTIGVRQLSQAEIYRNLRSCVADGDSNCTKAYINLIGVDKIKDPALAGLYGTTLSKEGRYQEALPLMEEAAKNGKVAPATVAQLCVANTYLHHYKEAISWCNAGLTTFGITDRQSYSIVKSFSDSLIATGQQIEALTLMNQYDNSASALNRPMAFQSDRIYLEKNFSNTSKQFKVFKFKNSYVTTIRVGSDKFYDAVIDTGATTTTISKKVLIESGVPYRFVRNAKATLADRSTVDGQVVTLDSIYFAGTLLRSTPAFVCDNCVTLIGMNALNNFNITTESSRGENVLILTRK